MPALLKLIRERYAPLAILAGASLLASCGPNNKGDQAEANDQLHRAGSDLKAAAGETAGALKVESDAARPGLKRLARDTDRSAAKLTAAVGDAAADAGEALATAGRRTDAAAHRAAADARAHADNVQD